MYWDVNSSKYHAARLALDEMGENTVWQGQTIMLRRQLTDGRPDKQLSTPELVWIEQQTGRFLKALTYRIRLDKKAAA
jgi:hypothetical protein